MISRPLFICVSSQDRRVSFVGSSTLIMSHFPGAQFQSSAPQRSSLTGVSFGFDFLLPLIAFLLAPLPRLVFLQSCIYHQKKKTTVRTEKGGKETRKKDEKKGKKSFKSMLELA
jgi:hypothetical protein